MRIDRPLCNFKSCRWCYDGNCSNQAMYKRCEYRIALATLEDIIKAQKLCVFCEQERDACGEFGCNPIFNGQAPEGWTAH